MENAKKIEQIKGMIKLAEEWSDKQMMPTGLIAVNTLRAIRRIINK